MNTNTPVNQTFQRMVDVLRKAPDIMTKMVWRSQVPDRHIQICHGLLLLKLQSENEGQQRLLELPDDDVLALERISQTPVINVPMSFGDREYDNWEGMKAAHKHLVSYLED